MKKYISRATKWLAVVALICVAVLFTGIILLFAETSNVLLAIGFITLGGLLGILFFSCFLAEKSRALIIDDEKIIFPRGTDKNEKNNVAKTVVNFSNIRSVESKLHRGDGIISGDCFFHTLVLKDGTRITVTLYAYGKDLEKEIVETIQNKIV